MEEEDRISKLPDEILISIISGLPLKEATSTTTLSTRWRHLHTHTTRLDFPKFRGPNKRLRNLVNIINGVLDSHRGTGRLMKELKLHIMSSLKEAGIEFEFEFEKLIEFALSREVEIIDIKMFCFSSNHYNLGLSKLVSSTNSGHPLPSFKCLNQLRLDSVSVDDQDFKILVSKFVALETLSIQNSHELRNVSIVGHPKLKHLDISHAYNLPTFEVREVMKLVSLRCYRLPIPCVVNFRNVRIRNVPKLVHFITDCWFFPLPSSIRYQLQILHLTLNRFITLDPVALPSNIKHLKLDVKCSDSAINVFMIHSLIHACPWLQKLKIKFLQLWLWRPYDEIYEEEARILLSDHYKFNPNLKEVEFIGFSGCPLQFTISEFIIDHAVALEKLMVVVSDQSRRIRGVALTRARRHFPQITLPYVYLQII